MPATYDYRCKSCGVTEELFFKLQADAPETDACPECRGERVRLASMGRGVHFKGSGFHCTDYPKPAPESAADYEMTKDGMRPMRKEKRPDGWRFDS